MAQEQATFAAGCFWGIEERFSHVPGVIATRVGYMGGHTHNPTYPQVCSDSTGHAEVVQVTYLSEQVSYEHLLDVFWNCHNPTLLNRQGPDVGTQYRSAIFYHNETQKKIAEESKIKAQQKFKNPIVTEIHKAKDFYPAEGEYKDFYEKNKNPIYCRIVIDPKIQKLYRDFKDEVVENESNIS